MREVAIIGIGMNRWGELWDDSLRDIFVKAALPAIEDAGVDHIDSMYVGCMSGGLFVGQEHLGSLLADYLGVLPIPAMRVESACASGGMAIRAGFLEVASGESDIVLVSGVEKMTDVGGDEATYALSTAADMEYEVFNGATFPGLYALIARDHMHRFGTTSEMLAEVAVKNHFHGNKNENAQYQMEITREQVLGSVMVADPLHILDCSPITDGAAALILCPLDMASKFTNKPIIKISAVSAATDTIQLADRKDFSELGAVKVAAEKAFKKSGKTHSDIDLIEVHDCFTIAELCTLEAMGFFERGKAGPATLAGETRLGGKRPVNVSGGLKSKGHPVGATGVAQVYELTKQLRGDAGERQVEGAKCGLAENMGGTGGSCVVTIVEVAK